MKLPIAQWQSQYETGDPIVDSQHQNLFEMINGLHYAILGGQEKGLLEKTFENLRNYTAVHFETEEQFMLKYDYPDYEVHRQKHDSFKARVAILDSAYTQNHDKDLGQLIREVSDLLTHWLIDHIQDEDQRMINFCSKKQSQSAQSVDLNQDSFNLLQWHSRYETGYTLVDDQHKAMFHSIKALQAEILANNATPELIERTLESLHNYITIHFETEEQFMLKTHYPNYEIHCQQHSALREKVESLEKLQKVEDDRQVALTLCQYLTNWFVEHINSEDQAMINFLREERSGSANVELKKIDRKITVTRISRSNNSI